MKLTKEVDVDQKREDEDFDDQSTQEEITNTIEKRKIMRMNSIWSKKRKQDKKKYVRVALLGPG
jgi:hypothetical protein